MNQPKTSYILGVDLTRFEVQCKFRSLQQKAVEIILGSAATISEVDFLTSVFVSLSEEERGELIEVWFEQPSILGEPVPPFVPSDSRVGVYSFTPAALGCSIATKDNDVCPGCGIPLVSGVPNPICEHPSGCGGLRNIPDVTPKDE